MSRGAARTVRAGRRAVEVQRPGKVLFPGRDGTPGYAEGGLARPGAPVAVPLAWKQVDDPEPGARR
ncbi:hypothetical protein SUDANB178_01453 [Streptomyces sp. enrichment culture]